MERKSDALFDFVVYRKKSGSTTRLLCGIPGPKRTPWEGGLFPVLMTCFSDPDQPPKCQYPPDFHHVNVYPSGLISASTVHPELDRHHEISIPELLFSLQKHLAHPFPDSTTQSPAYHCYQNERNAYNQKAKEQAETYNRKDFLKMASVAFALSQKEWIMVSDTMGGGAAFDELVIPTAKSPPVESTMGNESKRDCSCSGCAWGYSSYWDGRREMRFLSGNR
jgi:ubiquitin-protein ligase